MPERSLYVFVCLAARILRPFALNSASVPARRVWQVRYHGSVNRKTGMGVESDKEELLEDLHIEGVAPIVRRHVKTYAAMKGIKPADALMLLVQAGYDYLTPSDLSGETGAANKR